MKRTFDHAAGPVTAAVRLPQEMQLADHQELTRRQSVVETSLSPEWQTVCQDCGTGSCESARIQRLRQALGALPMAEPAVYWLYANPDGTWCVRHEGDFAERCFAKLELAREFIEMAVVRCSAYLLFLPRSDGSMVRQYFNWPSRAARQQTTT